VYRVGVPTKPSQLIYKLEQVDLEIKARFDGAEMTILYFYNENNLMLSCEEDIDAGCMNRNERSG
jgi:hypothetical protein